MFWDFSSVILVEELLNRNRLGVNLVIFLLCVTVVVSGGLRVVVSDRACDSKCLVPAIAV